MSEKYLRCPCASCSGRIEFPAEGIGTSVPCPHCGALTELTLETPPEIAARPARSLKWLIFGAVILVIGLVAAVAIVVIANRLMGKARDQRPAARNVARPPVTNAVRTQPALMAANPLLNGFSCSAAAIEQAKGSTLIYATGALTNQTVKARYGVTVELDLLDKSGASIGTAKDYAATIEPHTAWTFRAPVLSRNAASARVAAVKEQ